MRFAMAALTAIMPTLAVAQAYVTGPVTFEGREEGVNLDSCRQALAVGNIIRSDGATVEVFFDVALYVITITPEAMTCKAYRHING